MRDFYQDGFDDGYGKENHYSEREIPTTDGDRYSYRIGLEDGQRRKRVSNELERDDGYDN